MDPRGVFDRSNPALKAQRSIASAAETSQEEGGKGKFLAEAKPNSCTGWNWSNLAVEAL